MIGGRQMIKKFREGLKRGYVLDNNPFDHKGGILSESASAFYHKLILVTESLSIQVLTKATLTDLFYVKGSRGDKFNNLTIDFVLYDKQTRTPLLAINIGEFEGCDFSRELFQSVGVKLVCIEPKSEYDIIELVNFIESHIDLKYLLKIV